MFSMLSSGRIGPGDAIFWLIVVAIVFSLVRPGSKAGTALVLVSDALIGVIGQTTGYTARQEATTGKPPKAG